MQRNETQIKMKNRNKTICNAKKIAMEYNAMHYNKFK